jgi:hypothetical protein
MTQRSETVFEPPMPVTQPPVSKKQNEAPAMMMNKQEDQEMTGQWAPSKVEPAKKQQMETNDYSSSDEEETRRHKRHGKRSKSRRGGEKREKKPLPQHKVIKKLIQRELDRQGPSILEQVIRETKDDIMGDDAEIQKAEAKITKHYMVECDGCGIKDIIGVRYKCAVCKDFDFCEICEERLTHVHPFIKIATPELAPASIQVELGENQFQDVRADNEMGSQQDPFNVFSQFCQGRDWRQAAEHWMNKETRGGENRRGHCGYDWRQHVRGRGEEQKDGREHRGPRHFGGMMKRFCENLNEDPQKRDEICKNIGNAINQFVMSANGGEGAAPDTEMASEDQHGRGCNPKRAICTQKPEKVLVRPTQTEFA